MGFWRPQRAPLAEGRAPAIDRRSPIAESHKSLGVEGCSHDHALVVDAVREGRNPSAFVRSMTEPPLTSSGRAVAVLLKPVTPMASPLSFRSKRMLFGELMDCGLEGVDQVVPATEPWLSATEPPASPLALMH